MLLTEYDADLHMKATYEEGHEDGFKEGLLAGIQSLISSNQRHGVSKETTLNDLILEYSLSEKQAEEYLIKYW